MSRLADASRDALDPEGKAIWDKLAGPRKGMHGPYLMLMHVPQLAALIGQLGEHLRFHGLLPGVIREFAVLCTARALNVSFEWVMHFPIALKEGVSAENIELVRTNQFDELTGVERTVAAIARSVVDSREISDELFAQGLGAFGQEQFVELITLINFYVMIGGVINCFQVSLPDGVSDPF